MSAATDFEKALKDARDTALEAIRKLSEFKPQDYNTAPDISATAKAPDLKLTLGSSPKLATLVTYPAFGGTTPPPMATPKLGTLNTKINQPKTPEAPKQPELDKIAVDFKMPEYKPEEIKFDPKTDITIPSAPVTGVYTAPTAPTSLGQIGPAPMEPQLEIKSAPPMDIPKAPQSFALSINELSTISSQLSSNSGWMPHFSEYVKLLPRDVLLEDILNGRTGIPAGVEADIWNRHRERNIQAFNDSAVAAIKAMTKRGFIMPNGLAQKKANEPLLAYQNAKADESRDIAAEQAKLTQGNRQFAMDLAVKVENSDNSYNMERVKLEVAVRKDIQDTLIQVGNFYVNTYNFKLKIYETELATYREKLQAEKLKSDIFNSNLAGDKMELDLYTSRLEGFKTALSAEEIKAKIYESQLTAYGLTLKQDEVKFKVFESQVAVFKAKTELEAIKGKVIEIKGSIENTKASIFKTQVEAEVAKANVELEKSKINLSKQEVYMKQVTTELEKYRVNAEDIKLQIQQNTMLNEIEKLKFTSGIDVWKTDLDMKLKMFDYSMQVYKLSNDNVKIQNEGSMKVLDTEMTKYKIEAEIESKKADINVIEYQNQIKELQTNVENKFKVAMANMEGKVKEDNVSFEVKKTSAEMYKAVMEAYNHILIGSAG